jgi:hypothetical protein
MLDVFDPDSNRAVLADWLELTLAIGTRLTITDAIVVRGDQILEDDLDAGGDSRDEETGELLDTAILDPKSERRREEMWSELKSRQDALRELYPFVIEPAGITNWALSRRRTHDATVDAAHQAYIAALVMSSFKNLHIKQQKTNDVWSALVKEVPRFMQHLATISAASLMGQAYSFGWPREDARGFRDAIVDVLDRLGLGHVAIDFPKDATGHEKDGTVDVIAWRAFSDRLYGAILMYGQVASGSNWHSKPIGQFIDQKFFRFLSRQPGKHYLPALFIPFMHHNDLTIKNSVAPEDAIADYAHGQEMSFGTIVDRLRLTELIGAGLPSAEHVHNCTEPVEVIAMVGKWVEQVRAYCNELT